MIPRVIDIPIINTAAGFAPGIIAAATSGGC